MTPVFPGPRARRLARRGGSLAMSFALILALTQTVVAAAPANDLVSGATQLAARRSRRVQLGRGHDLGVGPDRLRRLARCRGPGPTTRRCGSASPRPSTGQLNLSAPTMQGTDDDFLAISFVYLKTGSDLTLIDCTAFGNDASWPCSQGTDLPDHGGRPLVGGHRGSGLLGQGRPRNDRDHPIGERGPLQLGRLLHVRRLRAHGRGDRAGERLLPPPARASMATPRHTSSTTTSGARSPRTRTTGNGSSKKAMGCTAISRSPTSRARSTRSWPRRPAGHTR